MGYQETYRVGRAPRQVAAKTEGKRLQASETRNNRDEVGHISKKLKDDLVTLLCQIAGEEANFSGTNNLLERQRRTWCIKINVITSQLDYHINLRKKSTEDVISQTKRAISNIFSYDALQLMTIPNFLQI